MIQWMVGAQKSNWHLKLLSTLWDYRTSMKTTTGFPPFHLVYGVESILPIECEILSLQLAIKLLTNTSSKEE
jgi:hypothetical protein